MLRRPSPRFVMLFVLLALACGRDLREARKALDEAKRGSGDTRLYFAALALRNPLRIAADPTRVTIAGTTSRRAIPSPEEQRLLDEQIWVVSFDRQPEGGLRFRSARMLSQILSREEIRRLQEEESVERWLLEDIELSVPSRVNPALPTAVVRDPIPPGTALVSIDAQGQIRVSSGEEPVVPVPSDEDVTSFTAQWKLTRDPSLGEAIVAIEADRDVRWRVVDSVVDALRVAEVDEMIFLTRNAAPPESASGVPDLFPGGLRYTQWPPKGSGIVPIPDPTPDEAEPIRAWNEPERREPRRPQVEARVPDEGARGPIQVGGDVQAPERLYDPKPQYTESARKARIQGIVIVQATIDEKGNVTVAKILKGLPMGLDQQALKAVRTWKFEPATLDGKPVSVYYNLTINFNLQ